MNIQCVDIFDIILHEDECIDVLFDDFVGDGGEALETLDDVCINLNDIDDRPDIQQREE